MLNEAWAKRKELYAEAEKVYADGVQYGKKRNSHYSKGRAIHRAGESRCRLNGLTAEAAKLHAQSNKMMAEGDMLGIVSERCFADARKLRAEGDLRWAKALIAVHGDIHIEWIGDGGCRLGNGEVYK